MKLITTQEADAVIAGPVIFKRLQAGLPWTCPDFRLFPNMRASGQVLVFSVGFLSSVNQWWQKELDASGFKYEPGSAECEAGTKRFIGRVMDMVQPFRGIGRVPQETIDEAKAQGHDCPTERLGDFTPGVYETRCLIPSGVNLNGVTDGGHSTITMLLLQPDGAIVAMFWEWQNRKWTDYSEAVAAGVNVLDQLD